MTEKRFELKSWNYNKLQAVIWDNLTDEKLSVKVKVPVDWACGESED